MNKRNHFLALSPGKAYQNNLDYEHTKGRHAIANILHKYSSYCRSHCWPVTPKICINYGFNAWEVFLTPMRSYSDKVRRKRTRKRRTSGTLREPFQWILQWRSRSLEGPWTFQIGFALWFPLLVWTALETDTWQRIEPIQRSWIRIRYPIYRSGSQKIASLSRTSLTIARKIDWLPSQCNWTGSTRKSFLILPVHKLWAEEWLHMCPAFTRSVTRAVFAVCINSKRLPDGNAEPG